MKRAGFEELARLARPKGRANRNVTTVTPEKTIKILSRRARRETLRGFLVVDDSLFFYSTFATLFCAERKMRGSGALAVSCGARNVLGVCGLFRVGGSKCAFAESAALFFRGSLFLQDGCHFEFSDCGFLHERML